MVDGRQRYEIPAGEWVGKDVIFGIKVIGDNGRDAGWSKFVALTVVPPPERPSGLHTEAVREGVRLTWKGQGVSFRVFRRSQAETNWSLAGSTDQPEWTDSQTQYGKDYQYMVQALVKAGTGEAESDLCEPAAITPVDHFAPAPPAGLTAIPSAASIELVWERNTEPDLAGYRIYRSTNNGPLERLAEIREVPSYSDTKTNSGKVYRYEISSFDQSGNESPHSAPVQVTAP